MDTHTLNNYRHAVSAGVKRNLALLLLTEATWGIGFAFVSISAIVPYYLREVGASNLLLGALPAVWIFAITSIQLWVAYLTSHLSVKKVFFTLVHYPGALAVSAMGLLAYHSPHLSPRTTLIGSFICMAVFGVSLGFATPMWTNLLAKLFPEGSRGKLFTYVFLIGGFMGLGGAEAARRVLAGWDFPTNFAIAFGVSGGILALSVTALLFLHEPAQPQEDDRQPFGEFVRSLWKLAGERPGFRGLLYARCVGSLGAMAGAFFAISARERFMLGDDSAAIFTMVGLGAQMVATPIVGTIGDRYGFRWFAPIGPVLMAAACVAALWAPTPTAFYLVFALAGCSWPADFVAMTNLTIEYCPKLDKTGFMALSGTIVAPCAAAAPLIGGWIAQHAVGEYIPVFKLTIALNILAAILMGVFVREPRRQSDRGSFAHR